MASGGLRLEKVGKAQSEVLSLAAQGKSLRSLSLAWDLQRGYKVRAEGLGETDTGTGH